MNNKSDGVKRTGDMMLSGWKLLSEHCPICKFPLMSKKDQMRCPGCDLEVLYEDEIDESKYSPDKTPSTRNSHTASIIGSDNEPELPSSLEEMKKEYDKKNARMNKVSSLLGDKMMAGWTLLGNICPCQDCNGTPLMKAKGDTNMLCVCCNTWYTENGHRVEVASKSEPKEAPLIAENTLQSATTVNQHSEKEIVRPHQEPQSSYQYQSLNINDAPYLPPFDDNDNDYVTDASEKIANKLLRGWTLLDQVCEGACHSAVPLMRDQNGKVMCVNCSNRDEVETVPANHSSKSASFQVHENRITSKHSVSKLIDDNEEGDDDEDDDNNDIDIDDDSIIEEYKTRRLHDLASNSTTRAIQRDNVRVAAVDRNGVRTKKPKQQAIEDLMSVQSRATSVIVSKIKVMTSLLDGCNNTSQTIELSNAIVALTEALHSVQGIKQLN